jgi:hypothetical protein
LLDRPKPTADWSASGRRRRKKKKKEEEEEDVLTPSGCLHPITQIYEPIFLPVLVNRMLLYFFFFDVLTLTLGEEVGYDS